MNLTEIRLKIDTIDKAIGDLINQRAEFAKQVAKIKTATDSNAEFYRPEREAQVLQKAVSRNTGPLPDKTMRYIFREIMSACLALEQPLKIAYLGPIGTYTQAAAEKHFGHAVITKPFSLISDVFREVELSDSHYGVVPVENSSEGVISHTLDQFLNSPLKICGEVELPIHHNLMSKNNNLKEIKQVYAHQQSLMQCKRWLDINLPNAVLIPVSSNAEAAKMIQTTKNSAAIAGQSAAQVYEHYILAKNIENESKNTTRFLVIGKAEIAQSGNDKTSMLLTTANKNGALYSLLKPFAEQNISLTKIESRPSRRENWEYVFFVDIEGHQLDENIHSALKILRKNNQLISILGSYPKTPES